MISEAYTSPQNKEKLCTEVLLIRPEQATSTYSTTSKVCGKKGIEREAIVAIESVAPIVYKKQKMTPKPIDFMCNRCQ